jgi:Ca2+-binding EF-hand superfamily protein
VRGAVSKQGGEQPYLGDEELMLWVSHATAVTPSPLALYLVEPSSRREFAMTSLKLAPLLRDFLGSELHLPLRKPGTAVKLGVDTASGELAVGVRFYPAGELVLKVCNGHNLASTSGGDAADVYIVLDARSRILPQSFRTAVAPSRGNPVWNETFVFDIVDHFEVRLALWEKETFTNDTLLGEVVLELDNVFRFGVVDTSVPMKRKDQWGGYTDMGMVRLEVDFVGPKGEAYPMLQPDRKAWSDFERRRRKGATTEEMELAIMKKQIIEQAIADEREAALRQMAGGDFSDNEIRAAFEFLDFDRNLVIGAAELRHVLTCMGELVTSEEIDEMIRLCDHDGDGQVSFYEFYQMAKAPNPGDPAWRPKSEAEFRNRNDRSTPGLSGGVRPPPVIIYDSFGKPVDVVDVATDAAARKRAVARAAENNHKAEKRRLCEHVVADLGLRLPELQACFKTFKRMDAFRAGGSLTYKEMCRLLDQEAQADTDDFRDIFTVFGSTEPGLEGKVNARQLLLALSGFCGATRHQRVNFCFYLFDEDGSGEIDTGELAQILQAAHLASRLDAATKAKAATVLAQADKDGNGTIGLEEFIVLATRFPGLLLPDFEARDTAGHVLEKLKTDTARARDKATEAQNKVFAQEARVTEGL